MNEAESRLEHDETRVASDGQELDPWYSVPFPDVKGWHTLSFFPVCVAPSEVPVH